MSKKTTVKAISNVNEIEVGMTIRVIDEEFETDVTLIVNSVEPADEFYGSTSVMVNGEYRVDVFEQTVYKLTSVAC